MRDVYLNLRLSRDERDEIKARAQEAGLTVSELIRVSTKRLRITNKAALRERVVVLNRINSNLNQIAHWVNAYKERVDAREVTGALKELAGVIKADVLGSTGREEEG